MINFVFLEGAAFSPFSPFSPFSFFVLVLALGEELICIGKAGPETGSETGKITVFIEGVCCPLIITALPSMRSSGALYSKFK